MFSKNWYIETILQIGDESVEKTRIEKVTVHLTLQLVMTMCNVKIKR